MQEEVANNDWSMISNHRTGPNAGMWLKKQQTPTGTETTVYDRYGDESMKTKNITTSNIYSSLFHHKCSQPKIKSKSTYCKDITATSKANKYIHTMEDLQLTILLTVYYALQHKYTHWHTAWLEHAWSLSRTRSLKLDRWVTGGCLTTLSMQKDSDKGVKNDKSTNYYTMQWHHSKNFHVSSVWSFWR